MLALTDEALALVVIAAGAVPARARARWLRQLAARLEPPQASNGDPKLGVDAHTRRISNGAARNRLYRSRQASGRVVLHIECDLNAATAALLDAGLLREAEIDDAAAVTRALEKVIALLPARLNDA